MQAGFACREVNPPLGLPMEGLGQQGGCQTIHDNLYVRTLWLQDGQTNLLIVSFDLLFFERPDIERFRTDLARAHGLAAAEILLNTTHNHAGPRLTHWAYSDGADRAYLDRVAAQLVAAAGAARAALRPVTMAAGMARTTLPVSRRRIDADGQAQWAPYLAGPVCDAAPFCLFREANGDVAALLFSASCHPSMIYSLDISADYPGAACRQLNAHFGTEGSIFLQGAAGDTKPRPVADGEKRWRCGTWEDMEEAGRLLAQPIIAAAASAQPVKPELRAWLGEHLWPMEPPLDDDQLRAMADDEICRQQRRDWARDMLAIRQRDGALPTAIPVRLHAMQLGHGLRLIALEGEPVAEIGHLILNAYDQGVTFALGYTDGCQVYLPVTRQLPEHGYEVDSFWEYHWPAPLASGCEQNLVATLAELIDSGQFPNQPVT